jgi:DNA-directed RNA polymerase specialized sigma subunit
VTEQQLETVKYLNQAFYLDKRINALIAEKETNISLATRCTANYKNDGSSNSTRSNSIESILAKIADTEQEITKKIDRLVQIRSDITEIINSVDIMDEQSILSYRYLSYKTMEQIAEEMHCDVSTVQRKHKKALLKCHCLPPC